MTFAVRVSMLAIGSLFAGVAAAQYVPPATVSQCRALDGFSTDPQGGAWLAVESSHDLFLGNKDTPNCQVKVVEASAKGKPGVTYVQAGPMAKDECSMYNYLSSIDSKLNQAKTYEAYATADSMLTKVNNLYSTGKLDTAGYNRIFPAVAELRKCASDLANQ